MSNIPFVASVLNRYDFNVIFHHGYRNVVEVEHRFTFKVALLCRESFLCFDSVYSLSKQQLRRPSGATFSVLRVQPCTPGSRFSAPDGHQLT
jgi:hypothetical protein